MLRICGWLLIGGAPIFCGAIIPGYTPLADAASTALEPVTATQYYLPNPFNQYRSSSSVALRIQTKNRYGDTVLVAQIRKADPVGGAACCPSVTDSQAVYLPIDISSIVNVAWTDFPQANELLLRNGPTFPVGSQLFGGIPFDIPAGTVNAWSADATTNGTLHAGTVAVTIPINVFGVSTVYTLLNTEWGQSSGSFVSLTFNGTDGATQTIALMGDSDIRDYNQDEWTNSISGATEEVWQNGLGQRLDRQQITLSSIFQTQTLLSMTLTDTGDRVNLFDVHDPATNAQRVFLSGVTVEIAIPEPPTIALLVGFGLFVSICTVRTYLRRNSGLHPHAARSSFA